MKNPELTQRINENWMTVAPKLFSYTDQPKTVQDEISRAIRSFYFGNKDPIISNRTFANLTNAFSDNLFFYGSREAALAHGQHAPTYVAILSIEGIWSQTFSLGDTTVYGNSLLLLECILKLTSSNLFVCTVFLRNGSCG